MELDSNRATQILIVGGGFGGVFTARNLEKIFPLESQVKITLVSQDNFFLMTPLLFEAMSGAIELGHCSVPIRDFLRHTFFIEAHVGHMELENRTVFAQAPAGEVYSLKYDHLVVAMGVTHCASLESTSGRMCLVFSKLFELRVPKTSGEASRAGSRNACWPFRAQFSLLCV